MRSLPRMLSLALCLCLLPLAALGEDAEPSPVVQSAFTLTAELHPEGFPKNTQLLQDWQSYLNKLELTGTLNVRDFWGYSRLYLDAILSVDGKERIPFVYDQYDTYRYIISPLFRDESVHLQMHNFLEFTYKPFHYMDLNTQYLGLLLYPEATYYVGQSYYAPIAEALGGQGTRRVSYDDLYQLCETLDQLVTEEHHERVYFFVRSLLAETGLWEEVLVKLSTLEELLDFLDPDQQGMVITALGNRETYALGEHVLFEKQQVGDALSFTLTLPDPDGSLVICQYEWIPAATGADMSIRLGLTQQAEEDEEAEEEAYFISLQAFGLPVEGAVDGSGSVSLAMGGTLLEKPHQPQMLNFRWTASGTDLPYTLGLEVDWLHPETLDPALTLAYKAKMKTVGDNVFVEGDYFHEDFFSLNEDSLDEYTARYAPTVALSLLPLVLEMPSSVLSSVVQFVQSTGLLSFLE